MKQERRNSCHLWCVPLGILQQRILVFHVCYCWSVICDVTKHSNNSKHGIPEFSASESIELHSSSFPSLFPYSLEILCSVAECSDMRLYSDTLSCSWLYCRIKRSKLWSKPKRSPNSNLPHQTDFTELWIKISACILAWFSASCIEVCRLSPWQHSGEF